MFPSAYALVRNTVEESEDGRSNKIKHSSHTHTLKEWLVSGHGKNQAAAESSYMFQGFVKLKSQLNPSFILSVIVH